MRVRSVLVALLLPTASCGLSVVGAASHENATVESDASTSIRPPPVDAEASVDAGPPFTFPTDCPPGAVYNDDFTTDPANRWQIVTGNWTWDAAGHSYTNDVPDTDAGVDESLVWIGARGWTSYTVEVEEELLTAVLDHSDFGPMYRVQAVDPSEPHILNSGNFFYAAASYKTDFALILGKFANSYTGLATAGTTAAPPGRVVVRIDITGSQHVTSLRNLATPPQAIANTTINENTYPTGAVGLRVYQASVRFTNVKVTCH